LIFNPEGQGTWASDFWHPRLDIGRINESNFRGVYTFHENGAYVVMCDASVRFLSTSIKPHIVLALMTRDGYETIHNEDLE